MDFTWFPPLFDTSLFQCHSAGYKILTKRDPGVSLTIFQSVAKCFWENIKPNLKIKASKLIHGIQTHENFLGVR